MSPSLVGKWIFFSALGFLLWDAVVWTARRIAPAPACAGGATSGPHAGDKAAPWLSWLTTRFREYFYVVDISIALTGLLLWLGHSLLNHGSVVVGVAALLFSLVVLLLVFLEALAIGRYYADAIRGFLVNVVGD